MNKIKLFLLCCCFGLISISSSQAQGSVNCDAVDFIGNEDQITLNNLNALSVKIEYFGAPTNWQTIIVCDGNCDASQIISNLSAGIYIVKLLMIGEAGALCFREEEVVVTGNMGAICDNQGGDADGDGVCAIIDCNDNDAAIGASQPAGTSCDDGNPNTSNDIIQQDGCTCLGEQTTGGTANCDLVNFSGGIGQFTLNNLSANSERIEYFGAATNWQIVGVCDGDCANSQTVTGLVDGTYIVKLLMIGNDGTFCYREEEVIVNQSNGNLCDENGGDADGDGICADIDCDDTKANIGAAQIPGTSCNDGNPNTNNDVIQADGCTCLGEIDPNLCANQGGDADGDGICANIDCDDTRADIGAGLAPGTSCDDGNSDTNNDVIQADGCTCLGEINPNLCANRGGDADGDGICADIDCDDTKANIGVAQAPGTSCDDGNPNTNNDIIQADGCTCLGEIDPNLCANQGGDADGDGICADIDCDDSRADIGLPQAPGTPCDDGNPNTNNDIIQEDGCICLGEIDPTLCENRGGDADGDGVCADIDCDDNSADIGVAQTPGTSCDDGNPNTDNDVIQADGCSCLGDVVDCDAVTFEGGPGTITVSNLTAPFEKLDIIGIPTNFELINICDGDCNTQQVISNLAPGSYSVKLLMGGAGGCYREEDVVVTSSTSTSSNRTSTELYLNGFANLQNIELQWVNTDKRPKNYFVLEKSVYGHSFEPIQIIKSQDIETDLTSYQEFDEQPETGFNYYRIGTAFSAGDFTYSEIIQVNFIPLNQFSIFPNPINHHGELSINLSHFAGHPANMIIYNSLGQPIQSKRVGKIGDTPIQIKLEGLADGVYTIGITLSGKRLQTRRFIVQRF